MYILEKNEYHQWLYKVTEDGLELCNSDTRLRIWSWTEIGPDCKQSRNIYLGVGKLEKHTWQALTDDEAFLEMV